MPVVEPGQNTKREAGETFAISKAEQRTFENCAGEQGANAFGQLNMARSPDAHVVEYALQQSNLVRRIGGTRQRSVEHGRSFKPRLRTVTRLLPCMGWAKARREDSRNFQSPWCWSVTGNGENLVPFARTAT